MSNRGLSPATITVLGAEKVEAYHLFYFGFTAPLYYTTAPYDITHDGNVYLSTALIKSVPTITESLKIKPSTLNLVMSGVDEALHALTLTENYKGKECLISAYEVSTKNVTQIFKGFFDSYESSEATRGSKSDITWTLVNHWVDWKAVEDRLLTDANQQLLFPGDLGLEFASGTDNVLNFWLEQAFSNAVAAYPDWARGSIYSAAPDSEYLIAPFFDRDISASFGVSLPIIYGHEKVPGLPVFRVVDGIGAKYLWVVYVISKGECEDLVDITFDDKSYTHADLSSHITMVKANNWHSGSDTQAADADLVADVPAWTSSHQLKGIAYCAIRYEYDKAVWSSAPQPLFEIKGKKLFDPRTGITAYSSTNALVLYDYLTNVYGKNLTAADLDAFDVGADYCEALQADHDAGLGGTPVTIPRFDFSGVISTADPIKKNVEIILGTMQAWLPWVNGKYKLVIDRDDDVGTYSIDTDNITGTFSEGEGGIEKRLNQLTYNFIDADNGYLADSVISDSPADFAEDNNRLLKKTVTNLFEKNRYRAASIAASIHKKSRNQIHMGCNLSNANALQLEPGIITNNTRAVKGWTDKPFRIKEMRIHGDFSVDLVQENYVAAANDWSVSVETDPPAKTTLIDPFVVAPPTALVVTSTDAEAIVADDGTTLHRAKAVWVAADDAYVVKYNIQYRENGAANWIDFQDAQGQATTEIYIPGVTVGTAYDVRVRSENGLGKISAWVENINGVVTGVAVVGIEQTVHGTNDFIKTTHFWQPNFESLSGFGSSNATLLTGSTAGAVRLQGSGGASATLYKYVYKPNPSMTLNRNTKFRATIEMTNAASFGASENFTLQVLHIESGGTQDIGVVLDWNTGTTMIDVWLVVKDATTKTTTLITSVADGTTLDIEVALDPNTTVTGTVNGVTITQSTNVPYGLFGGTLPLNMNNYMFSQLSDTSDTVTVDISDYIFSQGHVVS